jgi:hypothetical protein
MSSRLLVLPRISKGHVVPGWPRRESTTGPLGVTWRCWKSSTSATMAHHDSHIDASRHPLYPNLFAPLDLGPAGILPNRVLMGSMHTGLEGHSLPKFMESFLLKGTDHPAHHHDSSLERMATYFETRAKGGVGLMVTGTWFVVVMVRGFQGLAHTLCRLQAGLHRTVQVGSGPLRPNLPPPMNGSNIRL